MNNVIKIWVITIITVVTALLLPSIITYAEETRYNRDAYVVHIDDEGVEHQVINDMVLNEYNYNIGIRTFTILVYLNDVYSSDYWCAYEVMYNASNSTQNVHYIDDIYRDYEAKAIIKRNLFNFDYQQMPCIEMDCDYYYEFNKETGYDSNMLNDLFQSIINGDEVEGLKTMKGGYVWDEVIGDWVSDDVKYDLEVPQNVKVIIPDDYKYGNYKITWSQTSDFMKQDFYSQVDTEIYIKYYGNALVTYEKVNINDYESPFIYCDKVQNKKNGTVISFDNDTVNKAFYNRNKYLCDLAYDMNYFSDLHKLMYENEIEKLINSISGGIIIDEPDSSDFLIRNVYCDNGVTHYSNYVNIKCHNDGTYQLVELDADVIDDIKDEDHNIEIDNDTDDDFIVEDSPYDEDITNITDYDNIDTDMWQGVKGLLNNLKQFPTYFSKIFSFMPDYVISIFSFSVGAIIVIGLIKAIL